MQATGRMGTYATLILPAPPGFSGKTGRSGGPYTMQIALAGETLLEGSFSYLAQGQLSALVWDAGARFWLSYSPPVWM